MPTPLADVRRGQIWDVEIRFRKGSLRSLPFAPKIVRQSDGLRCAHPEVCSLCGSAAPLTPQTQKESVLLPTQTVCRARRAKARLVRKHPWGSGPYRWDVCSHPHPTFFHSSDLFFLLFPSIYETIDRWQALPRRGRACHWIFLNPKREKINGDGKD